MKRSPPRQPTSIEREIIAEIKAIRASQHNALPTTTLENPARLIRHLIAACHGNVQVRIATIAHELGVEMRTLERTFDGLYNQTMAECQVGARLNFSRRMLSIFPPTKVSAIATQLGYAKIQDFNRFFKKHMHQSPTEWSRQERARIAAEENNAWHG